MKISSEYMLDIWRTIRIPLIMLVIILGGLIFIRAKYQGDCAQENRTISCKLGNYDAVVEEVCCNACIVTIKLHRTNAWGAESSVFVYETTNVYDDNKSRSHDPVITWLNANELEIAVDRVGRITRQIAESSGIKIIYRIGSVDYP